MEVKINMEVKIKCYTKGFFIKHSFLNQATAKKVELILIYCLNTQHMWSCDGP